MTHDVRLISPKFSKLIFNKRYPNLQNFPEDLKNDLERSRNNITPGSSKHLIFKTFQPSNYPIKKQRKRRMDTSSSSFIKDVKDPARKGAKHRALKSEIPVSRAGVNYSKLNKLINEGIEYKPMRLKEARKRVKTSKKLNSYRRELEREKSMKLRRRVTSANKSPFRGDKGSLRTEKKVRQVSTDYSYINKSEFNKGRSTAKSMNNHSLGIILGNDKTQKKLSYERMGPILTPQKFEKKGILTGFGKFGDEDKMERMKRIENENTIGTVQGVTLKIKVPNPKIEFDAFKKHFEKLYN